MSDELKPCPFCGGEPEWMDIPDDEYGNTGGSVIECVSCGASTHVEFGFKENLIDTWNRRAASRELVPAMADRIEELKAKLAKAVEALELAINACDQGRMVTRPGRGVGGMTIEENIRGSIYINVPAWPIEEARAALAEINGGQP